MRRTLSVQLNEGKAVAEAVVEVAVQKLAAECNPEKEVADLAAAAEAFEALAESTRRQGQGRAIRAGVFKCPGAARRVTTPAALVDQA